MISFSELLVFTVRIVTTNILDDVVCHDLGKYSSKRNSEVCQDGYWNRCENQAGEAKEESVFFTRSKI